MDFSAIAPHLTHPLVLVGFGLFVVIGLFKAVLSAPTLQPAPGSATGRIIASLVRYGFIIAVLIVLFGFGLAFYREYAAARQVFDVQTLITALEGHGAEREGWRREREQYEQQIRELAAQAKRGEGPAGLSAALADAARTGNPTGAYNLLSGHAEQLAAEAAGNRSRAATAWRQAAALTRWTDARQSLTALIRATELEPDDIGSWIDRSRLEAQTGDSKAALASAEMALTKARAQGETRLEGVALNDIGDVKLAAGDRVGALAAYQAYSTIAESLAARDPGNAGWQRDLSISHNKIGDVKRAEGDRSGALAAYQADLAIAQSLAARDPGNAGWQRDLSVSHNKIGNVKLAAGDRAGALAAYQAGLAIAQSLAARDPDNAEWQRDLSVSHEKIGNIKQAEGDRAGALAAYQAGLAIAQSLAARDPGNAEWQRDLSVSHNRIGDVKLAEGDRAGALAAYQASHEIFTRLTARDPGNAAWQRDLSVSHERIGNVKQAEGDRAGALAAYQASHEIFTRLAVRDPGNAEWQRNLSVSHNKIGDIKLAAGDRAGALAAYQASLKIRETLAAGDPGNAEWQRDLVVSYWKIAAAQDDGPAGRAAALDHYRRALAVMERQIAAGRWAPVDAHWEEELRRRIAGLS